MRATRTIIYVLNVKENEKENEKERVRFLVMDSAVINHDWAKASLIRPSDQMVSRTLDLVPANQY